MAFVWPLYGLLYGLLNGIVNGFLYGFLYGLYMALYEHCMNIIRPLYGLLYGLYITLNGPIWRLTWPCMTSSMASYLAFIWSLRGLHMASCMASYLASYLALYVLLYCLSYGLSFIWPLLHMASSYRSCEKWFPDPQGSVSFLWFSGILERWVWEEQNTPNYYPEALKGPPRLLGRCRVSSYGPFSFLWFAGILAM